MKGFFAEFILGSPSAQNDKMWDLLQDVGFIE